MRGEASSLLSSATPPVNARLVPSLLVLVSCNLAQGTVYRHQLAQGLHNLPKQLTWADEDRLRDVLRWLAARTHARTHSRYARSSPMSPQNSIGEFNGGIYLILLHFDEPCEITYGVSQTVATLGPLAVYVGSMSRGLAARIERHLGLREKANQQWHIDYVPKGATSSREGIALPGRHDECALAKSVMALPGSEAVPGFGKRDCREECAAHLIQVPRRQRAALYSLAVCSPCDPADLQGTQRAHAEYLRRVLRSGRAISFDTIASERGLLGDDERKEAELRKTAAALGIHVHVSGGLERWRLRL